MAPRAKKIIRLKVETIAPDPNQYKPLSPVLVPDNLYLQVSIPKEEVIGVNEGGEMTITLDGFKALLKEVSHKLYETHEELMTEIRATKITSKKK